MYLLGRQSAVGVSFSGDSFTANFCSGFLTQENLTFSLTPSHTPLIWMDGNVHSSDVYVVHLKHIPLPSSCVYSFVLMIVYFYWQSENLG